MNARLDTDAKAIMRHASVVRQCVAADADEWQRTLPPQPSELHIEVSPSLLLHMGQQCGFVPQVIHGVTLVPKRDVDGWRVRFP